MAFRFAGEQLSSALTAAAEQQEKLREGGPVNYAAGVPARGKSQKYDIQGGFSPEFARAANEESPEFFFGRNGVVAKLQNFDFNAGLADPARDEEEFA